MVVFGGAYHHEQARLVEIGAAEFPEGAAYRIDHAGGHIGRAKAAVRGVIGRAELLGKQPGQRLHLIAAGKERELLGVGRTQVTQAVFQQLEGVVPGNRLEPGFTAFGVRHASQRQRQPRRRVLLHDARSALGANHALIQRVFGVAVDVTHFAVAQMNADSAAASAHVAGGFLDFQLLVARAVSVFHVCPRWSIRNNRTMRFSNKLILR